MKHFLLLALLGTLLAAPGTLPAPAAVPPARRVAFLIDSWHPLSHADVIGGRLLEGYRVGERAYASPVGISSVLQIAPRPNHKASEVAARYGTRLAGSVAEALLDDPRSPQPKLAVDGVLIAVGAPLPSSQSSEPSGQFRLFRETMAAFDRAGSKVPVFLDKNLGATWEESQAIVTEGERRGVPMMAGSVVPWVPLEPPPPAGRRPSVAVAVVAAPYHFYAIHVAELLQAFLETRGPRETGVASLREVGRGYWSLPDRERWGADILDSLVAGARTRRPGPRIPDQLGSDAFVVLVQYADGARGVMAFLSRQFDDSEFRVGARYDGHVAPYVGGMVLGPPYDYFGYLVHGLVQFFTTGRPVVPVERTLLTTGMSLLGLRSRESGGQAITSPSLAITYVVPTTSSR